MELDCRFIPLDDHVLRMELRPMRKNLAQLSEGAFNKGLLAEVVASQGMGPHHGPVDVLGYVFEEDSAVAALKSLEDFANSIWCDNRLVFAVRPRPKVC
jgi:hypothetical protein